MLPESKSVKPRNTHYLDLPIISIASDETTLDENGQLGTLSEFVQRFILFDGFLIVANRSARVLAVLQEKWQNSHGWTSKTTRKERVLYTPHLGEISIGLHQIISHYCGWKTRARKSEYTNRFSYFLDPIIFYGNDKTLQDIFGREWEAVDCKILLQWGQAVRRFCFENDLPYKQTTGGIGAQFLADRRFYPEPRRKVPKATNDRIRTKLPGNYCALSIFPSSRFRFNGHYIDQRRAHHYHAKTLRFPSSNSLFAYGDYSKLQRICLDSDAFLNEEFSGYICGDFTPPTNRVPFLPPNWRRRSISRRFVSSAEWPFLFDVGVRCNGIIAAWGSYDRDNGIREFAKHAYQQLDNWENDGRVGNAWLKPILLSTYGVLAVNANKEKQALYGDYTFLQNGQVPASWPAGDLLLWGKLVRYKNNRNGEPGITNVLHRALIESATRTESISCANYLASLGYRILMIHVDGLIVEDDSELPDVPLLEPWRYKSYLTGIEFIDSQSFSALEMTRMPGRPLRSRNWIQVGHAANRLNPHLVELVPE